MLKELASKINEWLDVIRTLPMDGGASVTRWVFVRTSEVISLGWLALAGGAVYRYIKFGTADLVFCGMVTTIAAGLFGFAQQAQVAKLNTLKAR